MTEHDREHSDTMGTLSRRFSRSVALGLAIAAGSFGANVARAQSQALKVGFMRA